MRLSRLTTSAPSARLPRIGLLASTAALLTLMVAASPVTAASGTDPVPTKRVPPVMPASCPDLTMSDEILISADTLTAEGELVRAYGNANILVGDVNVRFDVDGDGAPQNLSVTSSNASCFDAPSLASVAQWRFPSGAPATAVESKIRYILSVEDGASVEDSLEAFIGG